MEWTDMLWESPPQDGSLGENHCQPDLRIRMVNVSGPIILIVNEITPTKYEDMRIYEA